MDAVFIIIVAIMAVVGGFVGGCIYSTTPRREDVVKTQDDLLYATISEQNASSNGINGIEKSPMQRYHLCRRVDERSAWRKKFRYSTRC